MADLSLGDRLQPSLLDRLTDEAPDREREGPDRRSISLERLREVIQRDLSWLLNTCNLEATDDLSGFPNVSASTLNYGMPDLTGRTASGMDLAALERAVKHAVVDFEPRLLRHTVRVQAFVSPDQMNRNALTFQIEGELWAQPAPVDVVFKSEIDLESGLVSVRE